jgi:hypothetical protein
MAKSLFAAVALLSTVSAPAPIAAKAPTVKM